jgi:hypothetical protein
MVDTWFLMGSPASVLFIVTSYLYFVLILGPKLMAPRKPFNLQLVLVVYNVAVVLLSLYIFLLVSNVQQHHIKHAKEAHGTDNKTRRHVPTTDV